MPAGIAGVCVGSGCSPIIVYRASMDSLRELIARVPPPDYLRLPDSAALTSLVWATGKLGAKRQS